VVIQIHQQQMWKEELFLLKRQRNRRKAGGFNPGEESATLVAMCPQSQVPEIDEWLQISRVRPSTSPLVPCPSKTLHQLLVVDRSYFAEEWKHQIGLLGHCKLDLKSILIHNLIWNCCHFQSQSFQVTHTSLSIGDPSLRGGIATNGVPCL